jgi:uncharacterized membrane protein
LRTTDQALIAKLQGLNTVGTISYVLHLIVAVGALIPGGQFGPVLLLAALILDWSSAVMPTGTWQASHFRWRIRTVLIAGLLYLVTAPLWLLLVVPGWIAWTAMFDLVSVPHRDRHGHGHEQRTAHGVSGMSDQAFKPHDPNCIFCKIVAKQIPSRMVYEDDEFSPSMTSTPGHRCIF